MQIQDSRQEDTNNLKEICYLNLLPNEILEKILSYLKLSDKNTRYLRIRYNISLLEQNIRIQDAEMLANLIFKKIIMISSNLSQVLKLINYKNKTLDNNSPNYWLFNKIYLLLIKQKTDLLNQIKNLGFNIRSSILCRDLTEFKNILTQLYPKSTKAIGNLEIINNKLFKCRKLLIITKELKKEAINVLLKLASVDIVVAVHILVTLIFLSWSIYQCSLNIWDNNFIDLYKTIINTLIGTSCLSILAIFNILTSKDTDGLKSISCCVISEFDKLVLSIQWYICRLYAIKENLKLCKKEL